MGQAPVATAASIASGTPPSQPITAISSATPPAPAAAMPSRKLRRHPRTKPPTPSGYMRTSTTPGSVHSANRPPVAITFAARCRSSAMTSLTATWPPMRAYAARRNSRYWPMLKRRAPSVAALPARHAINSSTWNTPWRRSHARTARWRGIADTRSARSASRRATAWASDAGPWTVSASVNSKRSPVATPAPAWHAQALPSQPAGSGGGTTTIAPAARARSPVPSVE